MIHYNQLAKKFADAAPGDLVILEVGGMLPLGRFRAGHEREGEPIPPKIANGTLMKVTAVDVDNVTLKTEDEKTEAVFSHSIGAQRLTLRREKAFPTLAAPK